MAVHRVMPPSLDPDDVSRREFDRVRRGYDADEVRRFLTEVSDEMRRLRDEVDRREAAGKPAAVAREDRSEAIDRRELTARLGEEAARVLDAAQDAADEIKAKAEANVARLLREARDDAAGIRSTAEAERTGALEAAETDAARLRAEAEAVLEQARHAAEQELERVRGEGRSMVNEAREVRSRVLADLNERRRGGRRQLEQLRAARDSLRDAYADLRTRVDAELEALDIAPDRARAAADRAGVLADREPLPDDGIVVELRGDAATDADAGERTADRVAPAASDPVPTLEEARQRRQKRTRGTGAGAREGSSLEGAASIDGSGVDDADAMGAGAPCPPEGSVGTGVVGDEVSPSEGSVGTGVVGDEVSPSEGSVGTGATGDEVGPSGGADDADVAADDEDGDAVDRLFAKLRSDRAPVSPGDGPAAAEAVEPGSARAAGDEIAAALLARRAEAVDRAAPTAARALKRGANDWLNGVLDDLRSAKGTVDASTLLDGGLPEPLRQAFLVTLAPAVDAGAGGIAVEADTVLAGLLPELATRLTADLANRIGDESADGQVLGQRLRDVVREWRQSQGETVATDAVRMAFGAGVLAAQPDGTSVRWVCVSSCSPGCQQNSAADPVPVGAAFPSGHIVSPACRGCDCLVVPWD